MVVQSINHIDVTPGYCGGAPRIAGTRIAENRTADFPSSVHHIVVMVEHLGTGIEALLEQYSLTPGQLYAALSYYYDHQTETDRLIEQEESLFARARSAPVSPQEARVRAMWQG